MKKIRIILSIWFISIAWSEEITRMWTLEDGRSAELTATHIDGQRLHVKLSGDTTETLDLETLHTSDQIFAYKNCVYIPYTPPDYMVGDKPMYRSRSTWSTWVETFSKVDTSGRLLLSDTATTWRMNILKNATNSAALNAIKMQLLKFDVQKLHEMEQARIKELQKAESIADAMKPGEDDRKDKKNYSTYRGEEE